MRQLLRSLTPTDTGDGNVPHNDQPTGGPDNSTNQPAYPAGDDNDDVGNTLGGTSSVGAGSAIGDGGPAERNADAGVADDSMDQDTDR